MQLYFSLASAEAMQAICDAPLNALGLHYFSCIKIHADGGREVLTTHAAWLEYFFKHRFYHADSMRELEELPHGYYLWQEFNRDDIVYKAARELFDIDHGVTFIERHHNVTTLYFFAAHRHQSETTIFYQKNIDLLRRFILYFNDKAHALIKESAKHKIYLTASGDYRNRNPCNNPKRQQFLEMTAINKYIIVNHGKRVRLSRREAESAVHMINGHTAKQTARILGLSHRTIEKFNQRVKEKLLYTSRAELESVLKDSGIYQAIISK